VDDPEGSIFKSRLWESGPERGRIGKPGVKPGVYRDSKSAGPERTEICWSASPSCRSDGHLVFSIVAMAVEKIKSYDEILEIRKQLRKEKKRLVFTNGCFDILHAGHVRYLTEARALGDALIVGLNSDRSVQEIKGRGRPITPESERAEILAALSCIDYVFTFDDPTPGRIIDGLIPDVLVKGADWGITEIVGRETVEKNGGRVHRFPLVEGSSTTSIIERVLSRFGGHKRSDSAQQKER